MHNTSFRTSQEIDLADSDVLQKSDRFTETVYVSVDNSEEDSVLVISQEDDETLATNVKDEESRKDLLIHVDQVCLTAGEPNQGLCTYLNLAPNVDTKEDKLQVDELEALDLSKKLIKSLTITMIHLRIGRKQKKKLHRK